MGKKKEARAFAVRPLRPPIHTPAPKSVASPAQVAPPRLAGWAAPAARSLAFRARRFRQRGVLKLSGEKEWSPEYATTNALFIYKSYYPSSIFACSEVLWDYLF